MLMPQERFDLKFNYPLVVRQIGYPTERASSKEKEKLEVAILRICRERNGATVSDCVIETGEDPAKVRKTIEALYTQGLLTVGNRMEDGAVVYYAS